MLISSEEAVKQLSHMLGVATSHDASHHQDHYIFRIGGPALTLHFQLASWEGGHTRPICDQELWIIYRP